MFRRASIVCRLRGVATFLHHILILLLLLLFADGSELQPENEENRVVLLDTLKANTDQGWKRYPVSDSLGWLEESYFHGSINDGENVHGFVKCDLHSERDDWLYLPRIERTGANRMYIKFIFTVRDCKDLTDTKNCKENFELYYAEENGKDVPPQNGTLGNWRSLGMVAGYPITDSMNEPPPNTDTKSILVTKDAVYFAFRDRDACVSLIAVQVFYQICPEVVFQLSRFPLTIPAGSPADSIISVDGECVANAHPTGGRRPSYVCKGNGNWELLKDPCDCNPGYASSSDSKSCVVCPKGLFKSSGQSKCKQCPENSQSLEAGAASCICDVGFYRAVGENAIHRCTKPPSEPRDLRLVLLERDKATLEWDTPTSLGGREEMWYRMECLTCPKSARYFPSSPTFTENKLEISGLESNKEYTVKIFSENRVSEVAVSKQKHHASVTIQTKSFDMVAQDFLDMVVQDFKIDSIQENANAITISWKPPSSMAKKKLIYEVKTEADRFSLLNSTDSLQFTILNLNPRLLYSFKVRAGTGNKEFGEWSQPLEYRFGHEAFESALPGNKAIMTSDSFWSGGFPVFGLVLFVCVLTFFAAFVFIIRSQRSKSNRKHFSDCDGSYKNGTLTPDYNTPPHPTIMQSFFRGKLGAPLIQYGSRNSPACYGNNRFKPYVDPTAYEDPNQALLEFANDVDPNLIRITEVIGSGEFGEVCKGVLQPNTKMGTYDFINARTIAIKTLKPGSSDKAKADFLMEASIMGQFEHENVIRLIGVVTKSEPVMILTEYMENGSLDQFLHKHDDGQLQITQILEMLRGIAAGMKYLTEKGFVHRDLAARNVLVDAHPQLSCKIADFGLSRGLEGSIEQEYTTNGGKIPVRWTAPEAITHRKFTAASDVWSFGVVMWEVCSFGERPYWEWTNQKVIHEITIGYRLPAPMDTPTSLHSLMLQCWNIDRHRRPTFAQILQILEGYCRHPDLVYIDSGVIDSAESFPFPTTDFSGMHIAGDDTMIPSPPTSMPPPVPLYEFLKRAGLGHCSTKLHLAGVQTISDLTRLSQIDLLSYGLIAEEAQRLHKLLAVMQRTLSRQSERQRFSPVSQTTAALAHCRVASVPQAISTTITSTAANCDGFFV